MLIKITENISDNGWNEINTDVVESPSLLECVSVCSDVTLQEVTDRVNEGGWTDGGEYTRDGDKIIWTSDVVVMSWEEVQ